MLHEIYILFILTIIRSIGGNYGKMLFKAINIVLWAAVRS
nr:MAG TPA: hypothetical protein [Caudoviricetes sp.]